MLRGIVLCPDEELAGALDQALLATRMVRAVRASYNPSPAELERLIRQHDPQVFFLSLESPGESLRLLRTVEEQAPNAAVVAVGRTRDPELLLTIMRAGIREFLSPPFEESTLREALMRVASHVERASPGGTNKVYAFLPSKPGVGASTVALHTCLAMTRVPQTSVLLADFDLNNGMIGFMLRLNSQYSVVDAVEHAYELDEELWSRLVSSADTLDVLPAGRLNPGHRIDPAYLQPLMNFARRNYSVVGVDLSGMMEKFSLDLMREASRILLVCTPEVPALHLAAQKLRYLHSLELGSRVQILLNRAEKYSVLSDAEMERMLSAPVQMTLPNDYARLHKAMMAGQMVETSSKLGKRFEELARSLLESAEVVERKKPRFLEYFAVGTAEDCSPAGR
jgi:pilus assembly protein CpaE